MELKRKRAMLSFLLPMIAQQDIIPLVEEALEAKPDLFLVEVKVHSSNKIQITIDGDQGLPMDEIIRVSRFVESNLDREKEDFSLEVGSPGIGKPLKLLRQYQNNIGRNLRVHKQEETIEGLLEEVSTDKISIKIPASKKKKKPAEIMVIPLNEIEKAIVLIP